MKAYESPRLTNVGTVAGLTQGDVFQEGQDHMSWHPVVGDMFGDGPRNGGGFGS